MTTKTIQKFVSELCTMPGSNAAEYEPDPGKRTMGQVVRDSIGRAIQQHCKTESIAEKVVERLIQGKFRPSVGEIARAAAEISNAETILPHGCEICMGQPWITVQKTVIDHYTGQPQVREGAQRCDCAKGQWFRMKDRENKAKPV